MIDRPADNALGDLLDRLIAQAETEGGGGKDGAEVRETATPASSGSSGGLEGIVSNPALLTALPTLMKAFGGLSQGKTDGGGERIDGKGRPVPIDRHTALLCALKPYLSSERRQAAEQLIHLCRVWGTLQGMGISLPSLLSNPSAEVTPDRKGDDRV